MSELFKQGQKEALQEMFNRSKSTYQVNRMKELMNFGNKSTSKSSSESKEELNEEILNEYGIPLKDYRENVQSIMPSMVQHVSGLQYNKLFWRTDYSKHWIGEIVNNFVPPIIRYEVKGGNKTNVIKGVFNSFIDYKIIGGLAMSFFRKENLVVEENGRIVSPTEVELNTIVGGTYKTLGVLRDILMENYDVSKVEVAKDKVYDELCSIVIEVGFNE